MAGIAEFSAEAARTAGRGARAGLTTITVAAIAALGTYEAARGHSSDAALVVGLALCVIFSLLSRTKLLVLTVAILLLVPIDEAPSQTLSHVPLATLPFALWLTQARRHRFSELSVVGIALLAWTTLSLVFAAITTRSGLMWTLTFVVSPCIVCASGSTMDDMSPFKVFIWIAAGLGLYAGLEAFVLHSNPLMDSIYRHAASPVTEMWGTYRATTILGHPLVNATFFAVAGVLSFDRYLTIGGTGPAFQTGALILGEAATKSRGPAIAMGLGLAALLLLQMHREGTTRRVIATSVALLIAFSAATAVVLARSESELGQQSAGNRSGIVANTRVALAGHMAFGVGPGESEAYRTATQERGVPTEANPYLDKPPPPPTDLESAYAEMAVSIGLPGMILFLLVLILGAATGLRRRATAGLGVAIIVFGVSILGFNAIEGHPDFLVLLGLLLAGASADVAEVWMPAMPASG